MVDHRSADHFSETADAYAARRPTYPPALADFLAEIAPRRRLAWDAGCGSGQLSVLLAERFERVIGMDMSEEQLAHAAPHPNVDYLCARAEASGLPDGVVDLAVAAQAAHWLDLDGYYREVRRVSAPGAIIALVTYGGVSVDPAVDPITQRFHDDVLAAHWPAERRHVEDGYRSLPFPFEEIEPPRLEIRMQWTLAEFIGYVETWSGVRALMRADGRGPVEALRDDLSLAWNSPSTPRPVRWPLSLRVGRV